MTVTIYRSTDGGAPVLNGTAGSFVAVLDSCLVASGWTIAFTSGNRRAYQQGSGNFFYLGVDDTAGQTARCRGYETATVAGVSTTADIVGAGPFPIVFAINSVITGSPGTWTITGNFASYFTTGAQIIVADNTGTGNTQYTVSSASNVGPNTNIIVGSITGGSTGDGLLSPQLAAGCYFYKSTNSGGAASARDWIVIATNKQFYFWANSANTTNDVNDAGVRSMTLSLAAISAETENPQCQMMFFGDILSDLTLSADGFATMIIGDRTSTGGDYDFAKLLSVTAGSTPPLSVVGAQQSGCSGHYLARSYTQVDTSIGAGKYDFYTVGQQGNLSERGSFGNAEITMRIPSYVNGRMYMSPVWVSETTGVASTALPSQAAVTRGQLPGIIGMKHGYTLLNNQAPLTTADFADVLNIGNVSTPILSTREYFLLALTFVNGGTNPDNWTARCAFIGTNDAAWTALT